MLEHFRSLGRRVKIVLCLFYDISDFEDLNLNTDGGALDPTLSPSLAPTVESMDKFMAANVRPYPNTCDFDLAIHAAPVEDEEYGAERPHVPIVSVQYRKNGYIHEEKPAPGKKTKALPTTILDSAPDFRFRSHSREMGRLIADVARYNWDSHEQMSMQETFRQMASELERDPALAARMAAMMS